MASWEIVSPKSILILPAICSGDQRFFKPVTTYSLILSFLRRFSRPRCFRYFSALSSANRGVYRLWRGGRFRLISLETDDGFRPRTRLISLTEAFCQSISCIFSLSSIPKCLYLLIPRYFNGVLHLLVELAKLDRLFRLRAL